MDLDALGIFRWRTWNARLRLVVAASWLPNFALALALSSDLLLFQNPPFHHCRPDLALLPPNLRTLDGPALLNVSLPWLPLSNTWSPCLLLQYLGPDSKPNGTRPCTRGWEFERPTSGLLRTPITQWNLVCGDKWKVSLEQISFILSWLLGCVILGSACDRYGRRAVFVTSVALATVLGIGVSLSINFSMLLSLRVFYGACVAGAFLSLYVIRVEICDPDHRLPVTMVANLFFVLGRVMMPELAAISQDWKLLQGLMTLFLGLVLLFWGFPLLLPESPRWLVVTRQLERAQRVLWHIAESNFSPDDPSSANLALDAGLDRLFATKSLPQYHCIFEIFSTQLTWRNILILCFTTFLGYGIRFNFTHNLMPFMPSLTSSRLLLAGMEGAACLLLIPMTYCYGRRANLLLWTVIITVASLFLLSLIQDLPVWIVMFLSGLGLLASEVISVLSIFFSSEILPTPIRGAGLGVIMAAGFLGQMATPITTFSRTPSFFLHHLVFASFAVLSMLCILLLPESRGRNLPESLEEAEGRQSSLLFLHCWTRHVPLLHPHHQQIHYGQRQWQVSNSRPSVSSTENGHQRHESIWSTLVTRALGTRWARRVRATEERPQ
ncbi:putative solute carrier family 22 member 31 [Antechinus flavipes]|uniref:putative solute carrier family 22 member 31 n=1 Tax=Antechinus flavipes TaxID=38775 RepID=UPI002235DD5B|nr:putative solute carrier family 22 member 31 [Antechinus flavipes]